MAKPVRRPAAHVLEVMAQVAGAPRDRVGGIVLAVRKGCAIRHWLPLFWSVFRANHSRRLVIHDRWSQRSSCQRWRLRLPFQACRLPGITACDCTVFKRPFR